MNPQNPYQQPGPPPDPQQPAAGQPPQPQPQYLPQPQYQPGPAGPQFSPAPQGQPEQANSQYPPAPMPQYQPGPARPYPQPQQPQQMPSQPQAPGQPMPVQNPTSPYQVPGMRGGYTQQPVFPQMEAEGPSKSKLRLKALATLAGLVIIAFAAYQFVNFVTKERPKQPLNIAQAGNFSLQAPKDLQGYTRAETGRSGMQTYVSADDLCELSFGVVSADEDVAGTDFNSLVKSHVEFVRNENVEVDGPHTAAALLLADSSNGSKKYTLPSASFSYTGDTPVVTRYSAAILPNGNHAFVQRMCVGKDQATSPPQPAITKLEKVAAGITVQTK